MYFADRGIEELGERRGEEQVTLGWLAAWLQAFVDQHSGFDVPVGPAGHLAGPRRRRGRRTVNRASRYPRSAR